MNVSATHLFVVWTVCWLSMVSRGTAQSHDIYTPADPGAAGGIALSVDTPLLRAIALERDRTRVFDAVVSPDGKQASFHTLPTGKYDLVLLTRNRNVVEGLNLGAEPADLSTTSLKNLQNRVATGDTFFNRWTIHRIGIEGDTALVFVERLRDKATFQQSGGILPGNVRRFELLEMRRAADNWQVGSTRHLYREAEPVEPNPPFFKHSFLPALGGVRVIDQPKNLGNLNLPTR